MGTKASLWRHSLEKFDVILMRQGLCYCKDHSFDCRPPEKLNLTGVKDPNLADKPEKDSPNGIYSLAADFINGRPAYKKGNRFILYWRCKPRFDWVLEEHGKGFVWVWANVVMDCGIPACACETWYVWDGKDYVIDKA